MLLEVTMGSPYSMGDECVAAWRGIMRRGQGFRCGVGGLQPGREQRQLTEPEDPETHPLRSGMDSHLKIIAPC